MKSIFVILLILCCKFSYGQAFSISSLNNDLQNLYTAYLSDFKTIWGKRKLATDKEIVYHSTYRVAGSVDRTNYVIYNKLDRTFAFTCVMDTQYVKAAALNDAFKKIQLPVGKLTEGEPATPGLCNYVLSNKNSAPYKAKKLNIVVTKAADNITNENAREFSFKIVPVEDEADKNVKLNLK